VIRRPDILYFIDDGSGHFVQQSAQAIGLSIQFSLEEIDVDRNGMSEIVSVFPSSITIYHNPNVRWQNDTGDFNGDGKADILWQNGNGQAAIWLMNSVNPIAQSAVGSNPGASWHVVDAADFQR
jgi:hypothetical protein